MGENIQKRISIKFERANKARNIKERKKIRESGIGAGEAEKKGDT